LHDKAIEQASRCLNFGGLGFRKLENVSAPSHLASLIEARPCVAHLITLANEAGINLPSAQHIYESNVLRAREDCIARLDPGKGRLLVLMCDDAIEKAADRFKDILSGAESTPHDSSHASSRSEDYMLAILEEIDPEVPKPIKAIRLQHDLSVLFDQDGHDHLLAHFDAQPNSEADFMRLKDLRDETVSSKWLWTVDPRSRLTLDSEAFIAATRLRFGASFTCQPIRCKTLQSTPRHQRVARTVLRTWRRYTRSQRDS
jgi:hypothetical protein